MQLLGRVVKRKGMYLKGCMQNSGWSSENVKIGEVINKFQVKRKQEIEGQDLTVLELEHIDLKTKLLYLNRQSDNNNCLAINFKTLPENDKGVPHILEHLATCGSQNFQIRDPFMKMVKRSLNTFMNALTGPDFTSYPFSTGNTKDFENLMRIYMDITFRPLLRLNDFRQEGWRYTMEEGQLGVNGVVLNEMKGVEQDMSTVYQEGLLNHIHTHNCYVYNSGGHPNSIYQLSYQELQQFYHLNYHPSNCTIYKYGSYEIEALTSYIQSHYFQHFTFQPPLTVQPTTKWTQPKRVTMYSQHDPSAIDTNKQAKYSISFLCCDITHQHQDQLGLQLLAHMLLNTPTSAFYQAFIESHLAPQFSPGAGYDHHSSRQGIFSIGVADISSTEQTFQQVDQLIFDTLQKVKQEGFDKQLVDGTIQQFSINYKQEKSNNGIRYLFSLYQHLNHGADVVEYLKTPQYLADIAQRLQNGEKYFENLIEKYLLSNTHVLRLAMVPKQDYFHNSELKEQQFLQESSQKLTEEEKVEINRLNKELEDEQNKVDIEKEQKLTEQLPGLEVVDIKKEMEKIESEEYRVEGVKVEWLDVNTNGLTYLRLKFNLDNMTEMHRKYINLLCEVLPRVGSQHKDYKQMSQQLNLCSTNFSLTYHSYVDQHSHTQAHLCLSIACQDNHFNQMSSLLTELLCQPQFNDLDNLFNLVKQVNSQNISMLSENSMSAAMDVASANLSHSCSRVDSLADLQFLYNVCQQIQNNGHQNIYMEDIAWHLEQLVRFIITRARMSVFIHAKANNYNQVNTALTHMFQSLQASYINFEKVGNAYQNIESEFQMIKQKQFYKLPLQVNYCIQGVPFVNYRDKMNGLLQLFGKIGANTLLHREIREKGGAYGSGVKVDPLNSIGLLFSYRDPNTWLTFEKYKECMQRVADGEFNEDDLKDAKLSVFQRLDSPKVKHNKGLAMFHYGLSRQEQQMQREVMLQATRQQVIQAGQQHFVNHLQHNNTTQVIFGTQNNQVIKQLTEQNWHIIDIFQNNK